MGVAPRCRAICLLATFHKLPDILIKRTRKLMNESHAVADLRNRAVHDPWFAMEATGEPAQFKSMAYSDPIYGMTSMTEEELDDTLVEINKFKKIAQGLRDDFFVEISSSRNKAGFVVPKTGDEADSLG